MSRLRKYATTLIATASIITIVPLVTGWGSATAANGSTPSNTTPTAANTPSPKAYATDPVPWSLGLGTGVSYATGPNWNSYDVGGHYIVPPGTPKGHFDPKTGQWVTD